MSFVFHFDRVVVVRQSIDFDYHCWSSVQNVFRQPVFVISGKRGLRMDEQCFIFVEATVNNLNLYFSSCEVGSVQVQT